MEIKIIDVDGVMIALIVSDKIVFATTQGALDIMANCSYQGADCIIIREHNLSPDFFDLKTRIAGEILQKFSNYNCRLAIVGDFSKYESKALRDFIYESNKVGRINFVSSDEEAKAVLRK